VSGRHARKWLRPSAAIDRVPRRRSPVPTQTQGASVSARVGSAGAWVEHADPWPVVLDRGREARRRRREGREVQALLARTYMTDRTTLKRVQSGLWLDISRLVPDK
jgi:hypothetical protein